jgi:DNA-binding IclR family transcriptional regulator
VTTRAAVIATLAVSGPAYRFQAERIEKELAPMVAKAGREISSRLGYDIGGAKPDRAATGSGCRG